MQRVLAALFLTAVLVLAACKGTPTPPTIVPVTKVPTTPTLLTPANPATPTTPGPAAFCPAPGMVKTITAGLPDNFAAAPDPAPAPRPAFVTAVGNPPQTGFDGTTPNQHLLHSFTGLPNTVVALQLETRVKPLSPAENDDIALYSGAAPTLGYQTRIGTSGSVTGLLPNPWNPTSYPAPQLLTITLDSSNAASLITAVNSSGALDVQIEDDTSVDYLTLRLCLHEIAPPPKTPTSGESPGPTVPVATVVVQPTVVALTPKPLPTPAPTNPPVTPPPSTHCDLQVRKLIDTTGTPGTYQITVIVENIGSGACPSGETVSDLQPPGMIYTAAPAILSESGGNGNWTCTPTWQCGAANPLPPGYTVTFTLPAQAKPGTENCATVSDIADDNPANNRSCATVPAGQPVTPTPQGAGPCHYQLQKSVVLTDGGNPVPPGQAGHPAKVTITLTNTGPRDCTTPWASLTVSDTQPTGMTFGGPFLASQSGWSCTFSGGQVLCTGPALGVGQSVTITFAATVTGQLGTTDVRNCAGAKPMQIEACTLPEIP